MYKTAECVSPAHPDKMCDQISDFILDECLKQDPDSRVAVETMGGHGQIYITGEITTKAKVNYEECAREVLSDNRYNPDDYKYHINISEQSPNIANGVDTGGAGDQGIMVGYATRETETLIPFELYQARRILRTLWDKYPETRDAKSQVTTNMGAIITIVVSAERLTKKQIVAVLKELYGKGKITYHINPAGAWDNGGFEADAGVTGRKLAVDNYGPQVEIGGGAFSGKDYTKVDRSGAYIARFTAIQILKEKPEIQWCKVKIAYSIGVAKPVMISIETDKGNFKMDGAEEQFTPKKIQEVLELKKPIYYNTAKWGHFGNLNTWG